jgi:hypothetical protein
MAFFLILLASGIGNLMEPRVLGAAQALVMAFGIQF